MQLTQWAEQIFAEFPEIQAAWDKDTKRIALYRLTPLDFIRDHMHKLQRENARLQRDLRSTLHVNTSYQTAFFRR
jgi:hypothetical protein